MSIGENPYSERYQELQRLNVPLDHKHIPAPVPDWPRQMRVGQQGDDDWVLYDKGNGDAYIHVTDDVDAFVFDLEEVA